MNHSTPKKPAPKEETLNFLRKFAREYKPNIEKDSYTLGFFESKTPAMC